MFTIIELHSGEAVKRDSPPDWPTHGFDPVLFDREQAAIDWADEHLGDEWGKEFSVERVTMLGLQRDAWRRGASGGNGEDSE